MSSLDALLVALLVAFAVRGWWRGFCRETAALVGIFAGVLAAAARGEQLAHAFVVHRALPAAAALPVAWVAIFVAVCAVASLLGRLAEWLARALFLGGANRVAGVLFGCAKGATVLGFGLLLTEHALPESGLARAIAASRLGRPLERIAGGVVATGRGLGAPHERPA